MLRAVQQRRSKFQWTYSERAQRRPGHQPRRHTTNRAALVLGQHAQRRPGHQPRRHVDWGGRLRPVRGSLNEGRGINPGDTLPTLPLDFKRGALNEGRGINPGDTFNSTLVSNRFAPRSTKAGASTPATQGEIKFIGDVLPAAQRRPGHQPRRHVWQAAHGQSSEIPLNEGRGINPGDTCLPIA